MNENTKSLAFCGVALAALALVYLTSEDPQESLRSSQKGAVLFDFSTPEVAEIKVVEIENGKMKSIDVIEDKKGWFIRRPNFNYPSDATNQLGIVATSLSGLKIHDVESDKQGEHGKFGVLNPNNHDEIRKAAGVDEDIGKLIVLKDATKKNLAQLIIGKPDNLADMRAAKNKLEELKASGASDDKINAQEAVIEELESEPIRYARKPGAAEVISVKFERYDNISTKFVDWVEKDFLDLDRWEIKQVRFNNYEIVQKLVSVPGMPPHFKAPRPEKKFHGQYTLAYADGNWTSPDLKLSEGESLNKDVLDELKDKYLDDLEIIDVEKKPGELLEKVLADLWASNVAKNQAAFTQNQSKLGNMGLSLEQKGFYLDVKPKPDGRGLQSTIICDKGEVQVGMKDGVEYVLRFGNVYRGPEEKEQNATSESRYLLAHVQSNQSLLEPPEFESVPEPLPPEATATPDGNATKNNDPAVQAPAPSDANATAAYERKRDDRNAEIARINAANATKQKEYNDKWDKAKKRVAELNSRLAPWYYVISNKAYDKIHLERKDFVKAPEPIKAAPDKIDPSNLPPPSPPPNVVPPK